MKENTSRTDSIVNNIVVMLLHGFLESPNCTLTDEQKKTLANGELEEAVKNYKEYLPVFSMFVDAKAVDILTAMVNYIEILYDSKPLESNRILSMYKQQIMIKELKSIVVELIGKENLNNFFTKIADEMEQYFTEYPNFDKLVIDILATINGNKELNDYLAKSVDWMQLRNTPLKEIPQDLRLYHGTSLANWQMIVESGFLKPSDYTDVNEETETNRLIAIANMIIENGELRKKYLQAHQLANGYVYFSYGLDDPLAFSDAGYRTNLFDLNREQAVYSLDDTSVILELQNPEKYEISVNERNEFAVKGAIPAAELKPFFVHRKDGVITAIVDENGEDAYGYLCYE